MVIKNVNLETVCGITSKLPKNSSHTGIVLFRISHRLIFPR